MSIPVILDTDIGTDIDDTWALAFLLNSPELDLKLVSCATMNTVERAKIVAKMLEIAKRTDIPIAIGKCDDELPTNQSPWVADYSLSDYPGAIYDDTPKAIYDIVSSSAEQVVIIGIGPLPNIAETLNRYPSVVSNARFVGMHGSVYKGYNGSNVVNAEYNVAKDIKSAQTVFTAPWDITFTPLDTCGIVKLDGSRYERIKNSDIPLTKAVIENYDIWLKDRSDEGRTSTLYDTVAVYLAFDEKYLQINDINLSITDSGLTAPDKNGKNVRCAVEWHDMESFKDLLTDRLT